MVVYDNIKMVFIFLFFTTFFGMDGMKKPCSTHDGKKMVIFDINMALYCSMQNECGKNFLENLNTKTIEKEHYFSFIKKPFQSNHNMGLLNPVVQEYSLDIQKFGSKKFNFYYGAHMSCKGKVTVDGLNEYSNDGNTFLENAIIGTLKEHKIDTKFNFVYSRPGAQSSVKIPSFTEKLNNTIIKELTYVGNNRQRSDVDLTVLKRYFPSTLGTLPEITLGTFLYHILLNVTYSKDVCGNTVALPAVRDPLAKVVCEKYNITVYS